jgi:uncharacterized protein (DUF927 family)
MKRSTEIRFVTNRVGFSDDSRAYCLPKRTIPKNSNFKYVGDGRVGDDGFQSSGTFDGWKKGVGENCVFSSRLILALTARFAGPLLKFAPPELGNFGVSFFDKNPADIKFFLEIAESLSGNAQPGSWPDTQAELEQLALSHCDSTLLMGGTLSVSRPRRSGLRAGGPLTTSATVDCAHGPQPIQADRISPTSGLHRSSSMKKLVAAQE